MHNIGTNGHGADELWTMDKERKSDIINILIIIAVALGLGVYSIATTVVISKDGVGYIERARQFYSDPYGSLTTHHPGYPLLIFATHRFACLFIDGSSVFAWIYSAQIVSLLFRLLALIPLYFMGKWLVGSNKSFYAMLILIVLPNPAKMSCEVTREWPYLFFLAAGFVFLLWGTRQGSLWAFGLAGTISGLGYWLRPESVQIVFYGLVWLILGIFRAVTGKMARWKYLAAFVLLLISFSLPVLLYTKCTGNITSPGKEHFIRSLLSKAIPSSADISYNDCKPIRCYAAGLPRQNVTEALGAVFNALGENLTWAFLPFLFIGFFWHMRYEAGIEERFLLIAFLLTNLIMIVTRYCYVEPHVSKRWTLPLVAFTVFYIPFGLTATAEWLENRHRTCNPSTIGKYNLFLILFLIGICVCLPKLLRPAGYDKRSFRDAAKWLKENTRQEDVVAVPDTRISFYAQRQGLDYGEGIPDGVRFIVRIVENNVEESNIRPSERKEFSVLLDPRHKTKRIVIYRIS